MLVKKCRYILVVSLIELRNVNMPITPPYTEIAASGDINFEKHKYFVIEY